MIILAIDPGAKPGYCLARAAGGIAILRTSKTLIRPHEPFVVVVERPAIRAVRSQPGQPRPKGPRPQDIVTLGCTAGELKGRAESLPGCVGGWWIEVASWKGSLYRSGGTLAKNVFVARLRRDLELPDTISDDEVDACGIAWAFAKGAR